MQYAGHLEGRKLGDYSKYVGIFTFLLLTTHFFLLTAASAMAADLASTSDLISSSIPSSTSTTHRITFRATTAIPPSGTISIVPRGGAFNVPALLDFTDVDLEVGASTSTMSDRTLAASAGVGVDGVGVISGVSGSITITLGSDPGSAITAGSYVAVEIGSNATFGSAGDQFITNPPSQGSYHVRFYTRNAASVDLDYGSTVIAIVLPVGMSAEHIVLEPIRSNGLPTGLLPGSTQSVWLSLNTDIPATCRYATSSGVAYTSMLASTQFATATLGTLHFRQESVATNTIYTFYVRCQTPSLVVNTTDYIITFEIGVVPNASTTPPPPPPPPTPPGGGSSFSGGVGGGPYLLTGSVTLGGDTIPLSTLVTLKDGKIEKEETLNVLGNFNNIFLGLERGTYVWGVYVRDPAGRLSATYSSVIYLIGGTNNIIAPIYISPTISSATSTVGVGDDIVVSGFAIPLKPVLVIMNQQGRAITGNIITATTTANGNGSWSLTLSGATLGKGTYEIRARSIISDKDESNLSPLLLVGVGEDPNADLKARSDLNKDGKVNLVDFSILLFNWQGDDAIADINQDGTVNIVDFSIMLANWTG